MNESAQSASQISNSETHCYENLVPHVLYIILILGFTYVGLRTHRVGKHSKQ